jgi:hypothetical protein
MAGYAATQCFDIGDVRFFASSNAIDHGAGRNVA